jgi:uncharacterized membrane protein (UPF0127 family)
LKRSSFLIALLLLCAFKCGSATPPPAPAVAADAPQVIFPDNFAVKVEVASDDPTREQGLMYRNSLADDRGMIFFFPQNGEFSFWMKNTIIPLDMIWIDENRKIVHIASNVPPCQADPCPSYPPGAPARYVLEVAAGVAAKHHLADGNILRFQGLEHVNVR